MFETLFKYPVERFNEGELAFGTSMPGEVRLLLCLAAIGVAYYLYRLASGRLRAGKRNQLVTLRAMALVVLVIMILGPALRIPKFQDKDTFVAVMLDTSRSMSIADASKERTRFDAAREILGDGAAGLTGELNQDCALRVFGFGQESKRVRDLRTVACEEERTNLFRSVRDVDQELRGVPLAAVVMLTDGAHNTSGLPLDIARHLKTRGTRLYTIGFGSPTSPRDYEIVRVAVPPTVRRNTTVDAFTTVRCTGYAEPFTVYLAEGENVLSTMKVRPEEGAEMYRVRFRFYPEKIGKLGYRVFVKPGEDEKITDNNAKEFMVEVTESRLPVLYVEGSPRTEFRFIRRALFRDPDFRIVSILRTGAKRNYVQGAEDMPELKEGFPKNKELLYKFQAVIFGDIEAGYFSAEQLKLLEDFVKERGGGFAMLGGVNSFNRGGYQATPVQTMLPVKIAGQDTPYSFDLFSLEVPADALRHPILHQDDDPEQNKLIREKAPELKGYNRVGEAKAGAEVLGYHPRTRTPVLAVQKYGMGRVASFSTGGSWYWRMSVSTDVEIQEKFWRQMIRWLAVGSKEKVSVELDRDIYAKGEQVFIRATVLNRSLEAVSDAVVKAIIEDPYGNEEEVEMQWILTRDGVYRGHYLTRDHGDHKVTLKVGIPGVEDSVNVGTSFAVTRPFVEFNEAGLRKDLLREMAEATGGAYFDEVDAGKVAAKVKEALRAGGNQGEYFEQKDLWDAPIFFLLLIALLAVEWSLRRRAGLA